MSTVTEHRLALELAEKGYGVSDDEDEDTRLDEDDMVEIVKAAHDLRRASQATRVRYKVGFSNCNSLFLALFYPVPVCKALTHFVRNECRSQAYSLVW